MWVVKDGSVTSNSDKSLTSNPQHKMITMSNWATRYVQWATTPASNGNETHSLPINIPQEFQR